VTDGDGDPAIVDGRVQTGSGVIARIEQNANLRAAHGTDEFSLLASRCSLCQALEMGEHSGQPGSNIRSAGRKPPRRPTAEALGRRLLEVMVYRQNCRVGGQVGLDELETSEIGDWSMPDYKAACGYAASQGWLIARNDSLTLTTAGLAAA
jgi:hypothetical protein